MTEDAIAKDMEAFIRSTPRSWKEILQRFKGQNYRDVYRAFGRLRPRLGRVVQPPFFPYAFSGTGDFIGDAPAAPPSGLDRLHHKS
jgi:2,5-furandicarboxylate decarboxylase 1